MVVFGSVTGHISPELYGLVPGAEPADKATFISLLAKAPYPDLAQSSVQVSTTQDDDGVVVHGEWVHVSKIHDLLRSWMAEYGPGSSCSTQPQVQGQAPQAKQQQQPVGGNPPVVNGQTVQIKAEQPAVLGPVSSTSLTDYDEDESHDQVVDDSDSAESEWQKLQQSPNDFPDAAPAQDAAQLDSRQSGTGDNTANSQVADDLELADGCKPIKWPTGRPRGRPRRKGRPPKKTKALPRRWARSLANIHNQAIMKDEAETGPSENDEKGTNELEGDHQVQEGDDDYCDDDPDMNSTDNADCEVIDVKELQQKVMYVTGEGYKCKECGRCAVSEKNVLDHVARIHGAKNFRCKLCTKTYALPKDLQVHMAVHRKRFPCDVCHKMFATRYLMQGHRRRRHENPRKRKSKAKEEEAEAYACKHCTYVGKKLRHLLDHEQRIHGERKFSCPVCDKTYAVSKELKQHMRTHSEQYCCELCGRILKSRYAMKLHTDIQHKGLPRKQSEKTHLCTLCGLMFPNKTKYVIHQNKEHFNIRPYSCETCGMGFFAKANLKDHFKVHEDRRDYSCELCGKAFKMRQNLKMHMITHAEVRPYKCEVCDKSFTQNAALKRHTRIHTGERPFHCHMCSASFNDYSILTRHMQGIHRIDHYKFDKDKNWVLPPSKDDEDEDVANVGAPSMHQGPVVDKPFGCYICGKGFTQEQGLRRHIRMLHNSVNVNASNTPTSAIESENNTTLAVYSATASEQDASRGLYLPYLPPSHTREGLSDSANKVASALNTLAQELAMARGPVHMAPQHDQHGVLEISTDQMAARQLASAQDANGPPSSEMIASPDGHHHAHGSGSGTPVPLVTVRDHVVTADMLPPLSSAHWTGPTSHQPLNYTNAVYPISPPSNSLPTFSHHQYHQP